MSSPAGEDLMSFLDSASPWDAVFGEVTGACCSLVVRLLTGKT